MKSDTLRNIAQITAGSIIGTAAALYIHSTNESPDIAALSDTDYKGNTVYAKGNTVMSTFDDNIRVDSDKTVEIDRALVVQFNESSDYKEGRFCIGKVAIPPLENALPLLGQARCCTLEEAEAIGGAKTVIDATRKLLILVKQAKTP